MAESIKTNNTLGSDHTTKLGISPGTHLAGAPDCTAGGAIEALKPSEPRNLPPHHCTPPECQQKMLDIAISRGRAGISPKHLNEYNKEIKEEMKDIFKYIYLQSSSNF